MTIQEGASTTVILPHTKVLSSQKQDSRDVQEWGKIPLLLACATQKNTDKLAGNLQCNPK